MENENIKYVPLKKPECFRYLSQEAAVRAKVDYSPAVFAALEHDTLGVSEANGHFDRVLCETVLQVSGFFKNAVGVAGKLYQVLQQNTVAIETEHYGRIYSFENLSSSNALMECDWLKFNSQHQSILYHWVDVAQLRMKFQIDAKN
ncbi:hypothetical protein ACJMK2_001601 [Sinanodonta woodiana]|uniref:Uncharacterized protein n=1 Tax=Sinanodonta woodiana TaxID=1069815 RepID=A0ABD3XSR0_SINWO